MVGAIWLAHYESLLVPDPCSILMGTSTYISPLLPQSQRGSTLPTAMSFQPLRREEGRRSYATCVLAPSTENATAICLMQVSSWSLILGNPFSARRLGENPNSLC